MRVIVRTLSRRPAGRPIRWKLVPKTSIASGFHWSLYLRVKIVRAIPTLSANGASLIQSSEIAGSVLQYRVRHKSSEQYELFISEMNTVREFLRLNSGQEGRTVDDRETGLFRG